MNIVLLYTYALASLILFAGCETPKSKVHAGELKYPDGKYCATVDYHNPRTGTESSYILKVDIESCELIKIYWPNGGWLDNSHFTPTDISDGTASFESDLNVEYTVSLISEESECN
ncbi:hypothetical protein [Ferruginibacter sp.]